jgi:hypothetical protein
MDILTFFSSERRLIWMFQAYSLRNLTIVCEQVSPLGLMM